MKLEFIHAKKAEHSVTTLCRVLGVSKSGYYASAKRPECTRSREDRLLGAKVRASHEGSRGTYGAPRIHADLKEEGFDVSLKRIARLMQEQGLTGQRKKAFRRTTNSDHLFTIAPNVLERRFEVEEPNRAWVTDITYVRTWQGWLYLAVVIDLFSRRVVGWAADEHMRTELVVDALRMALGRRCPGPGLVCHSDRGSQYASYKYRGELRERGLVCSMSRRADCWDSEYMGACHRAAA